MLDFTKPPKAQPPARMLAQTQAIMTAKKLPKEWAEIFAVRMETPAEVDALVPVLEKIRDLFVATNQNLAEAGPMMEAALTQLTAGDDQDELDPGEKLLQGIVAQISAARAAANPTAHRPGRKEAHGRNAVGASWDHGSGFSAKMQDALYARMNSSHTPTLGREFAGASLVDMARATLQSSGHRLGFGRGAQAIMDALHTTSDFPLILGNTVNRRMLDFYEAAGGAIKQASREVGATDFRENTALRLSGSLELDKVNEAGEIKHGTLNEAGEKWQVATYAKIFGVTRQAMVNDDLGAFDTISRVAGQGAALTEAKVLTQLIVGDAGLGPVMSDGKALFHADHGNLASSGGAISITTLSAARTAMRRQTGLSSEPINVTPMFLVVPPELETVAEQIIAEITAADAEKVNPFTGKLTPLVDPLLTDAARWYLAAAPGRPDGLQHAYLDGRTGPQIMTREGWEVDGMEFKARLDFGAGVVDHRAWYMNPGQ